MPIEFESAGFNNLSSYKKIELSQCPLSHRIFHEILKAAGNGGLPEISAVFTLPGYSNEVVRINLKDGRSLMVKCARYDWVGPRFRSSRRASSLIREQTSLVAPDHLPVTKGENNKDILVYWHIPLPTLKQLWPELSSAERKDVLRRLGSMLRKVHEIQVSQYGLLEVNGQSHDSICGYMENDLQGRLKPAVWAHWKDAIPQIDRLTEMAADLPERDAPALVHNDLHLDNILCKTEDDEIHCQGLLDLEEAGGGRFESDLASAIVLHNPIFFRMEDNVEWLRDFDRHLLEGYGREPDPFVLRFYRSYHLINMGFFFAHSGDKERAMQIAEVVRQLI